MHMKKHLTQLLLSLLFLAVTAMTCDEYEPAEPIDVACTLQDVELYHWDNAGERPKEAVENRVAKEAYMLEIRLLTDAEEEAPEFYDTDHYTRNVLSDGITKIQIFTETAFSQKLPEGAEVTSCFYNYPKTIAKYQWEDLTVDGGVISAVDKINKVYKALLTIPQSGGKYRFRVVLTLESGATVERVSDLVSLY